MQLAAPTCSSLIQIKRGAKPILHSHTFKVDKYYYNADSLLLFGKDRVTMQWGAPLLTCEAQSAVR